MLIRLHKFIFINNGTIFLSFVDEYDFILSKNETFNIVLNIISNKKTQFEKIIKQFSDIISNLKRKPKFFFVL